TGNTWDPACADEPRKCAAALGVLGLGANLKEWTASDKNPEAEGERDAILRGAFRKEADTLHRCATRRAEKPDTESDEIGFRCCKGAPNAAVVPEPKAGDPFKKRELKGDELTKLLLADERTKGLAKDLVFFSEPEAAHTVVSRGPGDRKGFGFTVAALDWNPVAGSNYLVVTARSGKDTSFVLAYRLVDEKQYELASSFIMYDEPGPVALAYSDSIRVRLHFSSCWGCPGETGKILFRNPDDVVILQP
ncbi:MAG: SUMF1/EgtB/PvdO family nonheme iron enzyme, partial [Polyangiaceae bacterium]